LEADWERVGATQGGNVTRNAGNGKKNRTAAGQAIAPQGV